MRGKFRSAGVFVVGLVCLGALTGRAGAQGDPLPSWNDGAVKRKIIAFVTAATKPGAGFIKEQDRIAVFDNDGTLIQETPAVEGEFAAEQVNRMAKADPTFRKKMANYLAALPGKKARPALMEDLMNIGLAARGGLTEEEFTDMARVWLSRARHPKLRLPYPELRYQPMFELLQYLRANNFQTWMCTGGTADFIRVYAPTTYGIPPERIIGSTLKLEPVVKSGRMVLKRVPGVVRISDKEGKALGIAQQIGKRPVLCCGNVKSGGDIAMLRYTQGNAAPNLALLVNHDDAAREFAYGEPDNASLKAASAYGFTVISMKRDWKRIFPPMSADTTLNGKTPVPPAPASPAATPLIGKNWYLSELDGKEVPLHRGTRYPFVQLSDDGKVAGFAGVNTFFGAYETAEGRLKFGQLGATRMAGPPAAMELETNFLQALEKTDTYQIEGGILTLRADETVLARFKSARPDPPTGGVNP